MLNKIKNNIFLKNSILYTIGSMMTPIIGFILLPIYTYYLSPAEYAIMTTIQVLVGMVQIFLLMSLHSAVTRFYYDFLDDKNEQSRFLGSIYIFVLIFSSIIFLIFIVFYKEIGNLLFSEIPLKPFYFYMITLSWLNALMALPLALLRAQEKARLFVLINIIKALLIMLLTLYLIIVKGFGAEGALLSQTLVLLSIVVISWAYSFKYIAPSLQWRFVKTSLLFSIPLIPHVASGWIIRSSDRVILEKFVSLDEIGLYAFAVQVSTVLGLFYTSINNALVPRYTRLKKDKKDLESQRLLKLFLIIVIIFGAISIPVAMLGASLLGSEVYDQAIWLIPFLIIGRILNGLYFIPAAKLFYFKKTKAIANSSIIAAIVNIVINIIFIPFIGLYGAILSTIIAEVIRTLLIYNVSKKHYSHH